MKCCCSITCLFFSLLATAALSAETEECGLINSNQFENNAMSTEIDEFPWMARIASNLTKTSETVFQCQAVLISQQHLITVAHCLRDNAYSEPYAVLLGDWIALNSISEEDCDVTLKKCSTPLLIDIDEIIVHPYFNARRRENDVSLLRLTRAVTSTQYIRPICLPESDVRDKEFGSEELILTGWLHYKWEGRKRKTPVVIFNQHDCRRKYQDVRINITDAMMCGNACDKYGSHLSGSALMDVKEWQRKVYLVGMAAYGATLHECVKEMPDIFIRVDHYLDWIKENIY